MPHGSVSADCHEDGNAVAAARKALGIDGIPAQRRYARRTRLAKGRFWGTEAMNRSFMAVKTTGIVCKHDAS